MTKFLDLLQIGQWPSAREDQAYAERHFPVVVAESHLNLWSPGQPLATEGTRLLIGVATYSDLDLQLLDRVHDALGRLEGQAVRVDVFNTLDCKTQEDFDRYIPGIGKVYQTPVVGIWEDGVLKAKAWGKPARDLVLQACGLGQPLRG